VWKNGELMISVVTEREERTDSVPVSPPRTLLEVARSEPGSSC
jgi:hypothetical protein